MARMFKHHDTLRLFVEVAQYQSFSDAAESLHMTKGAISYQIKTLEAEIGHQLFTRKARGVTLTHKGRQLLTGCQQQFQTIEDSINTLKHDLTTSITVGMSSYFASRWLSPRLMTFMQAHPDIQLRIQPLIQMFDLENQGVDIAIRWGNGEWNDVEIQPFMPMPAWPVGNADAAAKVKEIGLARAFSEFTLLRDHDHSFAWSHWFETAGLEIQTRKDTLIIPDPNVRVQAVIDGQGIALNDALVTKELDEGSLVRLSDIELATYGYHLALPRKSRTPKAVRAFVDWISAQ